MIGDLAVVEQWLAAVNEGDAVHLQALTSEEVEIVGPRGHGVMNRQVLAEWRGRAGFRSTLLRWFCGGDGHVVVEQAAEWHEVSTGDLQSLAVVGSEFTIRDGLVCRYVRHDSGVADALAAACLDLERDLVPARP